MLTSWTRASSSFPLGPRLSRRMGAQRTDVNPNSNRNLSKSNSTRRSLIQASSQSVSSIVKKELSTSHWRDRNITSRFKLYLQHRSFHSSRQVNAKKTYYEVLGVEKTSTKMEIKKAYYEMAKKYHPDQNKGNSTAQAKFSEISTAYSVLSDTKKRKRYDSVGETDDDALEEGDAEELYDDVLKDGLGTFFRDDLEGMQTSYGNNVQVGVEINFLQSIYGGDVEATYRAKRPCDKCEGTGSTSKQKATTCLECDGRGISLFTRGGMKVPLPCSHCAGTGTIVEDACGTCAGQGVIEAAVAATAKIPPGVSDGSFVRLKGLGHAGIRNAEYGDVFLKVKVGEHPIFYREGDDIHLDVPLTVAQAALGGTVTIPTLSGEQTIEFPEGVQSGDIFKMPGFGSPSMKDPTVFGTQVNHFVVRIPTDLTLEQRELLLKFNQSEATNELGQSYHFGAPVTFKKTIRE